MYRYRGLGAASQGAQAAINSAAAQYGLNPSLLTAVANQESGLNQNAVSPVGAIGVMQLMPSTAASLGCDPNNMVDNIDCGAKYLAQLMQQFGGDTSLALAAYNAGPGAVNKYGGIPPYTETQNYVANILAATGQSPGDLPSTAGMTFGPTPDQLAGGSVSPASDAASGIDLSSLTSQLSSTGVDFSNPWVIAGIAAFGIGLLAWARA